MRRPVKSKTNYETRTSSSHNEDKPTRDAVRYGIASELHAPARRRFRRRRVVTKHKDETWQCDLAEMIPYAKSNGGMKYILTVIDVYSKHAWAEPVAKKTGAQIVKALDRILLQTPRRKPNMIQTDAGKEFYNATFSE